MSYYFTQEIKPPKPTTQILDENIRFLEVLERKKERFVVTFSITTWDSINFSQKDGERTSKLMLGTVKIITHNITN